jgi:cytochrome c oxidase assembly protein subunit 11
MSAFPQAHEPGLPMRWILALVMAPIAMMLFALFAFKPLYQLWCRASGTQLRPNSAEVAAAANIHTGRFVKVYFEATVLDRLPVSFSPRDAQQTVEVGIDGRNFYRFKNLTDHVLRMRPVHFISPINASRQFGMKVCFCFKDQVLGPGESREYPVVFTFSPDLDARIHTVSICYTLFALTPTESDQALDQRIQKTVGALGGVVSPRHDPALGGSVSGAGGTP